MVYTSGLGTIGIAGCLSFKSDQQTRCNMSDKKNGSQDDDKKSCAEQQPPQVSEAEKHLGATADEEPAQDDLKSGGKGTEDKQQQTA
jgi:hypothetical protein